MQYFKGDELEKKFATSAKSILDQLSAAKNDLLDGAYQAAPLGDVMFEDLRSPLANAIDQTIFRSAFKEIFDAFVKVGTFEAYLTVFEKIFGSEVEVVFTVPGPGKLNIDITGAGIEVSTFVSRYIEDEAYIFDEMIDDEGDFIGFQTIKGFQTQYELEKMLFEMVPGGIYTVISLTLGE